MWLIKSTISLPTIMASPLMHTSKRFVKLKPSCSLTRTRRKALKEEFDLDAYGKTKPDEYLCLWPRTPARDPALRDYVLSAYEVDELERMSEELAERLGPRPANIKRRVYLKQEPDSNAGSSKDPATSIIGSSVGAQDNSPRTSLNESLVTSFSGDLKDVPATVESLGQGSVSSRLETSAEAPTLPASPSPLLSVISVFQLIPVTIMLQHRWRYPADQVAQALAEQGLIDLMSEKITVSKFAIDTEIAEAEKIWAIAGLDCVAQLYEYYEDIDYCLPTPGRQCARNILCTCVRCVICRQRNLLDWRRRDNPFFRHGN